MRRFFLASALLAVTSFPAQGQAMGTRAGRGGITFELSDGEPISFFLEHSKDLELTDSQRASLIEIRRRLRATNAPFMRQLDSLRELVGLSMETRARLQPGDEEKLARLRRISQPVVDSMRANNQVAQQEARLLLEERQLVKLDSVATAQREGRDGPGRRGSRPPPA
jgi:hypothetical protein